MSSAGSRRRFSMKHPVLVVDVGCGCRLPKLTAVLSSLRPKPRCPKTVPHSLSSSSSSAAATSLWASSTTMKNSSSSSNEESASPPPRKEKEQRRKRRSRGTRKPAAESEAVVKESSEPYADFRESMLQMIVEKELYAWDDLNDLLHRFLSLNSPRHHHLILRAFADIWSPPSPYW